jgi:hypothetical protein
MTPDAAVEIGQKADRFVRDDGSLEVWPGERADRIERAPHGGDEDLDLAVRPPRENSRSNISLQVTELR